MDSKTFVFYCSEIDLEDLECFEALSYIILDC